MCDASWELLITLEGVPEHQGREPWEASGEAGGTEENRLLWSRGTNRWLDEPAGAPFFYSFSQWISPQVLDMRPAHTRPALFHKTLFYDEHSVFSVGRQNIHFEVCRWYAAVC